MGSFREEKIREKMRNAYGTGFVPEFLSFSANACMRCILSQRVNIVPSLSTF
jgi:hypothetical protein